MSSKVDAKGFYHLHFTNSISKWAKKR